MRTSSAFHARSNRKNMPSIIVFSLHGGALPSKLPRPSQGMVYVVILRGRGRAQLRLSFLVDSPQKRPPCLPPTKLPAGCGAWPMYSERLPHPEEQVLLPAGVCGGYPGRGGGGRDGQDFLPHQGRARFPQFQLGKSRRACCLHRNTSVRTRCKAETVPGTQCL